VAPQSHRRSRRHTSPMRQIATVVSVAVLLVACSSATSTSPSASLIPSVTAKPSASRPVTPSPQTPIAPRISWSEVEFDGSVRDLTADGSRFVSVGAGTDGASAWTSQDGRRWQEHDVPERSFGEIDEGVELTGTMGTLVRLGDTLYSFGGMSFMDAVAGAGWRWTDGEAWEVIDSRSPFFQGRVTAVAADRDALVATTISFAGGLYGSYTTWRWTPATSWTATGLSSSEDQDVMVEAIAWSDGTFVAAGSLADAVDGKERWEWPRAPAMWTSPDGADWTPVRVPAAMSQLCAVASAGGRFVAFGASDDAFAAWSSEDGAFWTRGLVEDPDRPFAISDGDLATPCRIVDIGDGLAVLTTAADGTRLWTSSNGEEWTFDERLPIVMTAAASLDWQVVVAGFIPEAEDAEAAQLLLVGTMEH
jgi:hypothetical protein